MSDGRALAGPGAGSPDAAAVPASGQPDAEAPSSASPPPFRASATSRVGVPLSRLFRSHYGVLLGFCRKRVRSDADAEDVVQSAFLAARRFYPDKGEDELRPLLFTLVRNFSVNRLRVLARQRRLEDISAVSQQLVCEKSATPERQVMDAQLLVLAEALIAAMPERRREALRLHRFEGLTYLQIAERLSVSPATAKNDVADAVAELAESLGRAGRPAAGPAE